MKSPDSKAHIYSRTKLVFVSDSPMNAKVAVLQ